MVTSTIYAAPEDGFVFRVPVGGHKITEVGFYSNGEYIKFIPAEKPQSFAPIPHVEPLHWRKPEGRV
jgi:hypothetical protein